MEEIPTWGPNRAAAVRMDRALSEFDVAGRGERATIFLLRSVLGNQKFRRGAHTTSLLEQMSHIQRPAS